MIVKENNMTSGSSVLIEAGDACNRCEKHKREGSHLSKCQMLYYFENAKCVFHAFVFSCRHSLYRPENAMRRVLVYLLNNGFTKEDIHKEIDNIKIGGKT